MTGHIHPWRRLRDLGPAWKLRWRSDLPWDMYGFTEWRTRTIHMREGMTFEERRCTILHEVEHVRRGPVSRCGELREETIVNQHCARLLMPSMNQVADSLAYFRGHIEDAAKDLWVDPWSLEVRLGSLYGLERRCLDRRMADTALWEC